MMPRISRADEKLGAVGEIAHLESVGINLPSGVTLETWESNRFATFEHGAFPTEPLVEFVETYFNNVLDLAPSTFTLKVTRQ